MIKRGGVQVYGLLLLLAPVLAPQKLAAHGGGLNDDGCHTGKNEPLHCHHSQAVADYYLQRYAGEAIWYHAETRKAHDGDTFQAVAKIWLKHSVETNVRIAGIDTPEIRTAKCADEKAKGQAAKKALQGLIAKGVILHNVRFDKYGNRVVADVYTKEFQNIALMLVNSGHARFYNGHEKRQSWCE